VLSLWLVANPSIADSDGYYCVGRNYLAYEFSFSQDPPGHHLYIVQVGGEPPISEPARLKIPDFQVAGLTCSDRHLDLLGGHQIYRIDISDPGRPMLTETRPLAEPGLRPDGFTVMTPNLGRLSAPVRHRYKSPAERVPLVCDDRAATYELRITSKLPEDGTPCMLDVVSAVFQMQGDATVSSRKVFESRVDGPCGE
jgi:hypothetical protein